MDPLPFSHQLTLCAAGSELFQLPVLQERCPALRFQLTCLSQALLTGVLPKVSINTPPQPGSSSGDLWGGAGRIFYLWAPNPAGLTDSCCSTTEIWRLFSDKATEQTQRESELLSIYKFRFEKSRDSFGSSKQVLRPCKHLFTLFKAAAFIFWQFFSHTCKARE